MNPEHAEQVRYVYAVLAFFVATGFVATLVVRWEHLMKGERILRVGLILEHLVIMYGAYVAIKNDFPPSIVGLLVVMSMIVILLGFLVWITDLIEPETTSPF